VKIGYPPDAFLFYPENTHLKAVGVILSVFVFAGNDQNVIDHRRFAVGAHLEILVIELLRCARVSVGFYVIEKFLFVGDGSVGGDKYKIVVKHPVERGDVSFRFGFLFRAMPLDKFLFEFLFGRLSGSVY
jgi:hypothetical protein